MVPLPRAVFAGSRGQRQRVAEEDIRAVDFFSHTRKSSIDQHIDSTINST
jgi:hypothetical protein